MKRRKFKRLNTDPKELDISINSMDQLLMIYAEAKEVDGTVAMLMEERGWQKDDILEAQREGFLYNPKRNTILYPPESSFPS